MFLVVSNITGVKINYFATLVLALYSVSFALKDLKLMIIIFFAIMIIGGKYVFFGEFSIKEMFVILVGPLIFNRFISDYQSISLHYKNNVFNVIVIIGFFIVSTVILQYHSVIPMSLGEMNFLNVVGVTVFGEVNESFRPSAYFYHPYDTALSIIPILSFSLLIFFDKKKITSLMLLIITCYAVYCLQLKIMYVFAFLLFFYVVYFYRFTIDKKVFLFLFLILTCQVIYVGAQDYSQEEIAFSAGRLVMWRLYIEDFFYDMSFSRIMFGLEQNPLERSVLWTGDEFFSAHNLYLFILVNTGFLFFFLFMFLKQTNLNKNRLVDFCIFVMMITFAYTGDLMVYTSYWVCISCLYVISDLSSKKDFSPAYESK